MTPIEIAANGFATISIVLAGRNSVHTWWTGIVGCALFVVLFTRTRLYADVVLQVIFIVTSIAGWWWWQRGAAGDALPVRRTPPPMLVTSVAVAIVVALAHGTLLHHLTNAYAPYVDSFVLVLSLLAQLLLIRRLIETWAIWLVVNSIAVPLYASRGLYLTAALYGAYWINAWFGALRWRRELRSC